MKQMMARANRAAGTYVSDWIDTRLDPLTDSPTIFCRVHASSGATGMAVTIEHSPDKAIVDDIEGAGGNVAQGAGVTDWTVDGPARFVRARCVVPATTTFDFELVADAVTLGSSSTPPVEDPRGGRVSPARPRRRPGSLLALDYGFRSGLHGFAFVRRSWSRAPQSGSKRGEWSVSMIESSGRFERSTSPPRSEALDRVFRRLGRRCVCGTDFEDSPDYAAHQRTCLVWRRWRDRRRG